MRANSIILESERPGFYSQVHHFLVWGQLLIALKHGAHLVDFCSSLGACYKKRVARPQTCSALSRYEWVSAVLYSHTKSILEGLHINCLLKK